MIKKINVVLVICTMTFQLIGWNVGMMAAASGKRVAFSGYEWEVKSGYAAPGSNYWSNKNAWVDEQGRLHLKISKENGRWVCAEVATRRSFCPGRFEFQIEGPINVLNANVVLGLFLYPDSESGPSEKNEIDIEFARWGKPSHVPGSYTVMSNTHDFPFFLSGTFTTHVIEWGYQKIGFQSFHGHIDSHFGQSFNSWVYDPQEFANVFPEGPLRIHMNLWLFQGEEPDDGSGTEIIIRGVRYIPM